MTTPLYQNPSKTAFTASLLRAFATKEADPNIQGSDDMAFLFLEDNILPTYNDNEKRQLFLDETYKAGGYVYMIARTKLIDHLFQKALNENLSQIVLLGAGFDTRAWRFPSLIQETQIFELDLPITQQWKQECFAQNGIATHKNPHYVPTTFNLESLESDLKQRGYDPEKKTFFILEGVTYYLSGEAVDKTLQFIYSNSCFGSTLIFDYVYRYVIEQNWMAASGESTGEHFKFGISEGQIENFLYSRSLKLIKNYSPLELESEFLIKSDGELFKPSIPFFCLAHTVVR